VRMSYDEAYDGHKWLTVFPDYPFAFAWLLDACPEGELKGYVGACYGDANPARNVATLGSEPVEPGLAEKICRWMERWRVVDEKLLGLEEGCDEKSVEAEQRAVDDEGLAIARLLKADYGDKFRVRYAYAWKHGERDWIVV